MSCRMSGLIAAAPLLALAFAGAAHAQQRPGCPTFTAQNYDRGTDPRTGGGDLNSPGRAQTASADPGKGNLQTADRTDCQPGLPRP